MIFVLFLAVLSSCVMGVSSQETPIERLAATVQSMRNELNEQQSFIGFLSTQIYTLEQNVELSFSQYSRVYERVFSISEDLEALRNTVDLLLVSGATTQPDSPTATGSSEGEVTQLGSRLDALQQQFRGLSDFVASVGSRVEEAHQQVLALSQTSHAVSTYVRWGSQTCSEPAQTAYSGTTNTKSRATFVTSQYYAILVHV